MRSVDHHTTGSEGCWIYSTLGRFHTPVSASISLALLANRTFMPAE
jgi:hypothetical protein